MNTQLTRYVRGGGALISYEVLREIQKSDALICYETSGCLELLCSPTGNTEEGGHCTQCRYVSEVSFH